MDTTYTFDLIADRYDLVNDITSFGLVRYWRRATVAAVLDGLRVQHPKVLDVAAGTGTSAIALAKTGADVTACDVSEVMAEVAKERYPHLNYVIADARWLPFPDKTFDVVTTSFGLRNMYREVEWCLREMRRVTKPGGRLLVCEFSEPVNETFCKVHDRYLLKVLPHVAGIITGHTNTYEGFVDSILGWPDRAGVGEFIRDAGWRDVQYRDLSGGIVALHRAVR